MIYFDNNATTPLHPEVKKAITDAMDAYGNPSSMHTYGRVARALIEEARQQVADLIGAEHDEIVFAGSGSEANNTVISLLGCNTKPCKCDLGMGANLITTSIEHPCILEASKDLTKGMINVTYLNVDRNGKIDMQQLKSTISPSTGIVSVMMANNEIGTIQDIKAITEIAHANGALMHTDAVQAVGKLPIDVKELGVDFLSFSGHKIYGPKGIGGLYVRKGVPFCPLIKGGHQEHGRRAGTENLLGIVGMGKAAEMRRLEMDAEHQRLSAYKQALTDGIKAKIPDVYFSGHPTDSLSSTVNVSFEGAEGEAILLYLDLEGIAVSTGSACASGSLDPSHVILATGLPVEYAHGSIRISMGRETTESDIERMLEVLPGIIEKIRMMSSAYRRK